MIDPCPDDCLNVAGKRRADARFGRAGDLGAFDGVARVDVLLEAGIVGDARDEKDDACAAIRYGNGANGRRNAGPLTLDPGCELPDISPVQRSPHEGVDVAPQAWAETVQVDARNLRGGDRCPLVSVRLLRVCAKEREGDQGDE